MPEEIKQNESQYGVSDTSLHTHDGVNTPPLDFGNMTGRTRYIACRLLAPTDAVSVANIIGGYFTFPFSGGFTTSTNGNLVNFEAPSSSIIAFASVDTAGTTGTTVVDVKITRAGGTSRTSIFAGAFKLGILTGSTSSLFTPVQPMVSFGQEEAAFKIGDKLSFDVTSVASNPPLGLTVYLQVTEV